MKTNRLTLREKLQDPDVKYRLKSFAALAVLAVVLALICFWLVSITRGSISRFEVYRTEHEKLLKEREGNITLWQDCDCDDRRGANVCIGCKVRETPVIHFRSEDDAFERTVTSALDEYTVCEYAMTGVCVEFVRDVLRVTLFSQKYLLSCLILTLGVAAPLVFIAVLVRPRWYRFLDSLNKGEVDEDYNQLLNASTNSASSIEPSFPVTEPMIQGAQQYVQAEEQWNRANGVTGVRHRSRV